MYVIQQQFNRYKRPIIQLNMRRNSSNNYIESQRRIKKLQQMLKLNLDAQKKLIKLAQQIDIRKKELVQVGVLVNQNQVQINQLFYDRSAFNEVKKIPILLQQQLLIKNNSLPEYGFLKNMVDENQRKKNKTKANRVRITNLALEPDPRKINFILQAEQLNKTGIELYKEWRKIHKIKPNNKIVSIDGSKLAEKRKIYGDNWEKIGYFFNGLTFQKLYYYYQENLTKKQFGKWSLRQNMMLIALVQYYGAGKWALISKKMKCKSQFQIRERFCNVLDPSIKENSWSSDDQKLLLEVAEQKNYKWSKIAKQIPRFANKTDNALRRKFRNLMIKKDNEEIRSLIKNKILLESILKFKKQYFSRRRKPEAALHEDE